MKPIIIIITFIATLGSAIAQGELLFRVPCDGITTDLQGNVFVSRDFNLDMLSADGTRQLNYSEPTYGNITQVDAGIASKILVFYRESGTIVLLNNELSPIGGSLSLFNRSVMTVTLAAMGNPNKIVLYDDANQDLLITDLSLKLLSRTDITFPGEFHPTDMQVLPEHRIALLDTLHGICLFDFYGTFEREIPIPGIQAMQLMKDQIIYLKDNKLYRYSLPTASTPMNVEEIEAGHLWNRIKQFHIFQNILYLIDKRENFPYRLFLR